MSDDWARFVDLFGRLRRVAADDPRRLPKVYDTDDGVRKIVSDIHGLDMTFSISIDPKLVGWIQGVNPTFIRSWREYEENYKHIVIDLFWKDLFGEEIDVNVRYEQRIEMTSDESAEESLKNLEQCMDQLDEMSFEEERFEEDYLNLLRDGVRAWKTISTNLDMKGFLRRLQLIPQVLVPSSVAMSQTTSDKGREIRFLYRSLQEAQMTFVCGNFLSSIVVVRSIVEDMLRHNYPPFYCSDKVELGKMIKDAHGLPVSVPKGALDRIRIIANYLIHPNVDNASERQLAESIVLPGQSLEKFNLHALRMTRRLIEGASRLHNDTIRQ